MKKSISILAGVLGLQALVALSMFYFGNAGSSERVQESLLNIDKSKIAKIVVSGANKELSLVKAGTSWRLGDKDGLPVNENKIKGLEESLSSLRTQWPVATTASSHSRFEVAEDNFNRKISIYYGDKPEKELFVGTSPGFKKSHVRLKGEDEVYALELNSYDLPTVENEWLDKNLLAVKSLTSIEGADYQIAREGESWRFEAVTEAGTIDSEAASKLVKAVESLRVLSIAEQSPDFSGETALNLNVSNGKAYSFDLMKNEGTHYIRRNDIDRVFTLNKYEYEKLTKPNKELLTVNELDDEGAESDIVATGNSDQDEPREG